MDRDRPSGGEHYEPGRHRRWRFSRGDPGSPARIACGIHRKYNRALRRHRTLAAIGWVRPLTRT
jgi:hypothetical protein